jgi:hypothetical protein
LYIFSEGVKKLKTNRRTSLWHLYVMEPNFGMYQNEHRNYWLYQIPQIQINAFKNQTLNRNTLNAMIKNKTKFN